jgi:hypothetical protein
MLMNRNGLLEEVFATFTYSPITDARGNVVGIHNTALDTTAAMIAERRMRALRAVARRRPAPRRRSAPASSPPPRWHPTRKMPHSPLLYLIDHRRGEARLAGATGLEAGAFAAPHLIDLSPDAGSIMAIHVSAAGPGHRGIGRSTRRVDRRPRRAAQGRAPGAADPARHSPAAHGVLGAPARGPRSGGSSALVKAIRADEAVATTPVVPLTARAGEEDAIEAFAAGANDYIVKPFSARERIARVGAQLQRSQPGGTPV